MNHETVKPELMPQLDRAFECRRSGRTRDALMILDELVGDDPSCSLFLKERGLLKRIENDLQGAICDFTAMIRLLPKSPTGYLERAVSREFNNELDLAILDYSSAIILFDESGKSDMEAIRAFKGLVTSKSRSGDVVGALDGCTSITSRWPQRSDGFLMRAEIHSASGEFGKAIADLSLAIPLEDDKEHVFIRRGENQLRLKEYGLAIDDFTAAMGCVAEVQSSGLLNRGIARWKSGDDRGAISDLDLWVSAEPDVIDGYLYRGQIHWDVGNFESAIADFSAVTELSPRIPIAYWLRAEAKLGIGDTIGATEDRRKWEELGGGGIDTWII